MQSTGRGQEVPPRTGRGAWAVPPAPSNTRRPLPPPPPPPPAPRKRTATSMPGIMNRSFVKKKEEITQKAEEDTEDHVKEEEENALAQLVPFAPRRTKNEQTPPENNPEKKKGYGNWTTTCDLVGQEGGKTPPVKKPRVVPAIRSAQEIAKDPNIIIEEHEYTSYWLDHGCKRYCKHCEEV